MISPLRYLGRLAPSPTGYLHLGHARTFWIAAQRAEAAGGKLRLRNDDLDQSRCRPAFVDAMQEDLLWLGLRWEAPLVTQSERLSLYGEYMRRLHALGVIYPCFRSRRDVAEAAGAPHEGGENDEPLYPREWRPSPSSPLPELKLTGVNWRFRVPDGERLSFTDGALGEQSAIAGTDFGDFLVWRKDGFPSYQLASVVDDAEMDITEVVRGADLVKSTFRQLLLFGALGKTPPAFYHCPLLCDEQGTRLAKRHDALSLRHLRESRETPESLKARFAHSLSTT